MFYYHLYFLYVFYLCFYLILLLEYFYFIFTFFPNLKIIILFYLVLHMFANIHTFIFVIYFMWSSFLNILNSILKIFTTQIYLCCIIFNTYNYIIFFFIVRKYLSSSFCVYFYVVLHCSACLKSVDNWLIVYYSIGCEIIR